MAEIKEESLKETLKKTLKENYDIENILNNINCNEDSLTNEQKKLISDLVSNFEVCFFEKQKSKTCITYGFNCKQKDKINNLSRINCDLNIQKFSNTSIYYYINNFTNISPVLKKLLIKHKNFISNINNFEVKNKQLEKDSMIKINNTVKKILPDIKSKFILNKDLGMVSYPQIRLYNFKIIIIYKNLEENKIINYTINFNKANQKAFIKDEDAFIKNFDELKKLFFWLNQNSSKKKCKLYPSHGTIQKTYVSNELEKTYLKNIKDVTATLQSEILIITNLHFEGEMIYFIKNEDEYKHLIGDEEDEDQDIIKKQQNYLDTLKKKLKFLENTNLKPEEDSVEINNLDESLKIVKNTNANKKKNLESDDESEIDSEPEYEKNNSLCTDIESSEDENKKSSSKSKKN